MLKKSIWIVLHMTAVAVLSVSLILGFIIWYSFGFRWDVIFENVSYEESDMLCLDMQNETVRIWDYYKAKCTLEEWEETHSSIISFEDFYHVLMALGIPEEDFYIIIEEYGLTEDRILEFLKERYGLMPSDVAAFLSDLDSKTDYMDETLPEDEVRTKGISDIYQIYEVLPEEENESYTEDVLIAQEQYVWGCERYNPEYTNLCYEIIAEGEVVDSNHLNPESRWLELIYTEEQNGYQLCMYLDTDYSVSDEYSDISYNYNLFQDVKWIIFGAAIAAFIFAVVSLIMLTRMAGVVKGYERIRLSWLDHPPLEITIIFWVIVALGVITGIISAAKYVYVDESLFWLIAYITIVLLGTSLSLTGYLSLVRRIKSHTLWRNSIIYMILSAIKKLIRNLLKVTSVSKKIMIACSGYVLLMFMLLLSGKTLFTVLAILLSVVGLFIIYRDAVSRQRILEGMEKITSGELDYQVDLTQINLLQMEVAESINQVGSAMNKAVQQSLKDERLRADLITNVSHDIKTPLTSIINYVDLLKREEIGNGKAAGYLEILDQKSQRLKQLTEDLVEASKLSSGNVVLNMEKMDFNEILQQALGEFEEKFESKKLQIVLKRPEGQVAVMGEGRRIWRILENLFQNVYKYAMPGTRVYAELAKEEKEMIFTLKNISQHALNIDAEDLTERFIRGDVSRTTEGSGLGLSIARDLAKLQKGGFEIYLDGDLFKAVLRFELIEF